MNRPSRPVPLSWTLRLRGAKSPLASLPRPAARQPAARPGIAARWKSRERVRAAGA